MGEGLTARQRLERVVAKVLLFPVPRFLGARAGGVGSFGACRIGSGSSQNSPE
jgi:hypothetical protein